MVINHKQFIHFKVFKQNKFLSWVTAVYASPIPSLKKYIWDHLGRIANTMQDPWLVGEDFNSILYASEKRGGSSTRSGVCGFFKNWFNTYSLYDLHSHGPKFTWARGNLLKSLDRALCNAA